MNGFTSMISIVVSAWSEVLKTNRSVRSRRGSSPGNLSLSALKWLDTVAPLVVIAGDRVLQPDRVSGRLLRGSFNEPGGDAWLGDEHGVGGVLDDRHDCVGPFGHERLRGGWDVLVAGRDEEVGGDGSPEGSPGAAAAIGRWATAISRASGGGYVGRELLGEQLLADPQVHGAAAERDLLQVGGVGGQAAQRVGGRDHRVAVVLQPRDDTVPAGGVGERAVHQHDRRPRLRDAVRRGAGCPGGDQHPGDRNRQAGDRRGGPPRRGTTE